MTRKSSNDLREKRTQQTRISTDFPFSKVPLAGVQERKNCEVTCEGLCSFQWIVDLCGLVSLIVSIVVLHGITECLSNRHRSRSNLA